MHDALKSHFYCFAILFFAKYGGALPSLAFPLDKVGSCDFTWYTKPEIGNPLYGLRSADGILSHTASGRCVSMYGPICEGFTVFPPSWQASGCSDDDGSQVPCCIRGSACVQADFKVSASMKKGICQDSDLACDSGRKVASDDCPYDDRYNTRSTCCLPIESFQDYTRAMSTDLQPNLVAVAPPPSLADDGIATNSLPPTPEQAPANTPGEAYLFPIEGEGLE